MQVQLRALDCRVSASPAGSQWQCKQIAGVRGGGKGRKLSPGPDRADRSHHHVPKIWVDIPARAIQVVWAVTRRRGPKTVPLRAATLTWVAESRRVKATLVTVFDQDVATRRIEE